jgi:plastocyanin
MEVPEQCQPVDQISINTNTHKISPRNICADPGGEIRVSVVPEGSVRIQGKSGWPTGEGESFTITAPDAGDYDYNVYFEDDMCIDPRITVR